MNPTTRDSKSSRMAQSSLGKDVCEKLVCSSPACEIELGPSSSTWETLSEAFGFATPLLRRIEARALMPSLRTERADVEAWYR